MLVRKNVWKNRGCTSLGVNWLRLQRSTSAFEGMAGINVERKIQEKGEYQPSLQPNEGCQSVTKEQRQLQSRAKHIC
jgi:hypothetical protein